MDLLRPAGRGCRNIAAGGCCICVGACIGVEGGFDTPGRSRKYCRSSVQEGSVNGPRGRFYSGDVGSIWYVVGDAGSLDTNAAGAGLDIEFCWLCRVGRGCGAGIDNDVDGAGGSGDVEGVVEVVGSCDGLVGGGYRKSTGWVVGHACWTLERGWGS